MNKIPGSFCLIILISLISCSDFSKRGEPEWLDLFNGEDLAGWVQMGGQAPFYVSDNTIVGTSVMNTPNSFLCTRETYSDFILEYEFIVDPPLNSGVQIRSLSLPGYMSGRVHGYQVEIDPSPRAWTAGIYDEARKGWLYALSGPGQEEARGAFRNNEWNKVRVEAIGSHIKTWLNDVPVTNLFDDETAEGFIALQVHSINDSALEGSRVMWRNIRIITENPEKYSKETTAPEKSYLINQLTENEVANGWSLLFDGETGSGWRGACSVEFPEKGWIIEDGSLTVLPAMEGEPLRGGDLVSDGVFTDFELELQAKLTPIANSGVKYFVKESSTDNSCTALGPEYQVIDNNYPGLNDEQKMGSLYDLKAPQGVRLNPVGQWNTIRIVARGGNVEHWLNGFKVVEYDRNSADFDLLVEGSKFRGVADYGKGGGHILLQDHRDEVSFRSIKIRTF